MNCASRLVCEAPRSKHVTLLLDLPHWMPADRRIEYNVICYNQWSLALLPVILVALNCTRNHALSALRLIIAHFLFQADTNNCKDSAPVPPSATVSFSLCIMLRFCLPSSHRSKLNCSLSVTPNTSTCLQPASSKRVCVCVCVCVNS